MDDIYKFMQDQLDDDLINESPRVIQWSDEKNYQLEKKSIQDSKSSDSEDIDLIFDNILKNAEDPEFLPSPVKNRSNIAIH